MVLRRLRSVGTRLFLLVGVPLVGVAILASTVVSNGRAEATSAEEIRSDAARLIALERLHLHTAEETFVSAAALLVADAGIPVETVEAVTGLDLPAEIARFRAEVDADLATVDLTSLPPDIQAGIEAIPEFRRQVDTDELDLDTLAIVFDFDESFAGYVEEELRSLEADVDLTEGSAQLARQLSALDAIEQFLQSQVAVIEAYAVEIFPSLVANGLDKAPSRAGSIGAEDARSDDVEEQLSPEMLARWYGMRGGVLAEDVRRVRAEIDAALEESGELDFGQQVQLGPRLLEASLLDIEAGMLFIDEVGLELRIAANAVGDQATNDANRALAIAVTVMVVTLLLTMWVMSSITRPLRRLEDAAQRVASGELRAPISRRGPREIGLVAKALDGLRANIAALDDLADGRFDDGGLTDRVGADVQDSVRRLADETQALRKRAAKDRHAAAHDALTGLPNRSAALDELTALLDVGRNVGVLYLDLDGFKSVNDRLGHLQGDATLVEVAAQLRANVRGHEMTARIGGDEFVCLIPDADDQLGLHRLASRLIESIERNVAPNGMHVSACAGMAIATSGSDDPVGVLGRADEALYRAKAKGRGSIVGSADSAAILAARPEPEAEPAS